MQAGGAVNPDDSMLPWRTEASLKSAQFVRLHRDLHAVTSKRRARLGRFCRSSARGRQRAFWKLVRGRFAFVTIILALLTLGCGPSEPPDLEVFHGEVQRVGHLGAAQPDFNLMGRVSPARGVRKLVYSVNGGDPVRLSLGLEDHGFGDGRRLGATGDFNADISISSLVHGSNTVTLTLSSWRNDPLQTEVLLERDTGSSPLPLEIRWSDVDDPQDVGQYVDGRWRLDDDGLRTAETGYDRLFLLGDTTWQDYELTASFKIHEVDLKTGPASGANGLGVIMRFAGHVDGGPRNFGAGQPKWGYQPFGAIAWLRWLSGPTRRPSNQFYRGDGDSTVDFDAAEIEYDAWYMIKALAESLPDTPLGLGVTKYSFKIWPHGESEPTDWVWQEIQESRDALRRGGAALVAHHVDVTFGDITVVAK